MFPQSRFFIVRDKFWNLAKSTLEVFAMIAMRMHWWSLKLQDFFVMFLKTLPKYARKMVWKVLTPVRPKWINFF